MSYRIHVETSHWDPQRVDLYIGEVGQYQKTLWLPLQITQRTMLEGEAPEAPTLRTNIEFVQDLYLALHQALEKRGLRPEDLVKREALNEGRLIATTEHLQDLRSLLGLTKPSVRQLDVTTENPSDQC